MGNQIIKWAGVTAIAFSSVLLAAPAQAAGVEGPANWYYIRGEHLYDKLGDCQTAGKSQPTIWHCIPDKSNPHTADGFFLGTDGSPNGVPCTGWEPVNTHFDPKTHRCEP